MKCGHCVQVAQSFTDAVMCTVEKWEYVYARMYVWYKTERILFVLELCWEKKKIILPREMEFKQFCCIHLTVTIPSIFTYLGKRLLFAFNNWDNQTEDQSSWWFQLLETFGEPGKWSQEQKSTEWAIEPWLKKQAY